MDARSLGYRTDLALLRLGGGEVVDRGTHLVVRTPDNPTFHWGNFLLLAAPPEPGLVDDWIATFVQEFPEARHRSFGIDGLDGTDAQEALRAFQERGYQSDTSTVMTARALQAPPRPNTEATIRPLSSDDDWEQQIELAMDGEDRHVTLEFAARRTATDRGLTQQGHGQWFGAFLAGRLAASLGIMRASAGLARYQLVKTRPAARGRGLAGTLVHEAGRFALAELGADTVVMVADPDYPAIRVYRSVGLVDTETQLGTGLTPG